MAKKYAAKCFLGKQSLEFEGRSKVGGEEGEGHSRNVSTLHNSFYPTLDYMVFIAQDKKKCSCEHSICEPLCHASSILRIQPDMALWRYYRGVLTPIQSQFV